MKKLPFKVSPLVSLGVELELQIIHPQRFSLEPRAKDLMRLIKDSHYQQWIKPEITQSMIEINSSIHHSPNTLLNELISIQQYLLKQAEQLDILFCGGGTHPFQKWSSQKIFPTLRFKNLSRYHQYLSKCATVFGQHIHIGCRNSDEALYLTHALARYIPHFVALSASSPFYEGVDTGHHSARLNVFNAFPLSGFIPYLLDWHEFSAYFYKLRHLKIISSMKDFYWDVRPKPEFGTVEIRVCDTPLTLKRAVMIAAYAQSLAHYLLLEKPFPISQDIYFLYQHNRFQATRYGMQGTLVNALTGKPCLIRDDISETIDQIAQHTQYLKNSNFIQQIKKEIMDNQDDVTLLRNLFKEDNSLVKVVEKQSKIWSQN